MHLWFIPGVETEVSAKLIGAELVGTDLSEAALNAADLSKADLREAHLIGANFRNAILIDANFNEADLRKADLSGTNLIGAIFYKAKLGEADLSLADLSGAKFFEADLCEANLYKATVFGAYFTKADLNRADLSQADLGCIDLVEANLSRTNLTKADLSLANLSFANLTLANLNEANLIKADFTGADLTGADFTRANLTRASFIEANLQGTKLNDSLLTSTDFDEANLREANISGANIYSFKTPNWQIDNIICTHIYNCPNTSWDDPKIRKQFCRNFTPGEFESLYKTLSQIKSIFQQRSTSQDITMLLSIIESINTRLPLPLDVPRIENSINPSITLTAESLEELDQTTPLIDQKYNKLEKQQQDQTHDRIPDDTSHTKQLSDLENSISAMIKRQLEHNNTFQKSIIIENHGIININQEPVINNQYNFSSEAEAEVIAQKIIDEIIATDDKQAVLKKLDEEITPQLKADPEKIKWLQKALEASKNGLSEIKSLLLPILLKEGASKLFELLSTYLQ